MILGAVLVVYSNAVLAHGVLLPFAGGISEEQGRGLLLADVAYAEHAVDHLVTAPLSQGQYDALVSLAYNEGAGNLQSSTRGNYVGFP